MNIPTGSISSGTLRKKDLILTFLDFIREHDPVRYEAMALMPFGSVPSFAMEDENSEWWEEEEASILLNAVLWESMEDMAPEGYYFGAHPGDGADFGYWEIE